MTGWNDDNTEGFTGDELAALNEAQDRLEAEYPTMDASNIADRLNNAFLPGMTADALVAAAKPAK